MLPCLLTGGTEVSTLQTAKTLNELGFEVHVLVYFDEVDAQMLTTFEGTGAKVVCLNLQRQAGSAAALKLALALLSFLLPRRYLLIWVQYITPTLVPLLLARLFGKKLVSAVHVSAHHYGEAGLARLRWMARNWCSRLICVSHTTARGIFGSESAGLPRLLVIPNAVNIRDVRLALRRDWRREMGWNSRDVLIAYVGRLVHNKGVDVLINATAQLARSYDNVRLILVGEGPELQTLSSLAERLGIRHLVHFAGRIPISDIFAAFKGADIAVVPSREEGFGLSALEAMAVGLPLVASRVDALAEIVRDGETGLLFEPSRAQHLAQILSRLIQQPVLRQHLGSRAAFHAEGYAVDVYRARIAEMLTELQVYTPPGRSLAGPIGPPSPDGS